MKKLLYIISNGMRLAVASKSNRNVFIARPKSLEKIINPVTFSVENTTALPNKIS